MELLTSLLLLADDAQAEGPNPLLVMGWIPIVIIAYFVVLIWPQRREQKRQSDLLANLKKDDEVMTNGGIFGKVISVAKDDSAKVVLRIDENARMTVHKNSIGRVLNVEKPEETKKD